MTKNAPQRFFRVHLVSEEGKADHFYLWAPDVESAMNEAERWTGSETVIVDDCTPRSRERLAA